MVEDKNLHQKALEQFNDIWTVVQDERELAITDRRFYSIAGAMWEGPLGDQFENKPKIEVNKAHLSVIRIFNEWRNNRIDVDFVSVDGSEDDGLADVCDGLYRADEKNSGAMEAYDNAFEEGVGGGYGAWRLTTEFEDEDDDENEKQRIMMEPIYDADQSVFFDLGAKRQDKRDATHSFVLTPYSKPAYELEFGETDYNSWPKDSETATFDWVSNDVVYVAEYYVVTKVNHTVFVYQDVSGEEVRHTEDDFEKDPDLRAFLEATGSKLLREKKTKRKEVRKYILSGEKILGEENGELIPGKNIPIVPFYGKRWYVDNIERCMGHVRLVKDVQRLKNIQISKLAEISATSAIEKPIFTPAQVAGHELTWAEDNIKNNPYLLVNPVTDAQGNVVASGPIGYTKPPAIGPAMGALLQITEEDIQDLLGNQQAGEELDSNVSGKAVELVQNRLDMQTFIYMSNMGKAFQRSGEIWLEMAKEIYVESDRTMKTIGTQGEVGNVTLGEKITNEKGEVVSEGDLTRASFNVEVDVGPSTSSKKASIVRGVTGMMSVVQDPETNVVLGALALMNMEGEGLGDIKEWNRKKLVKMGVLEPTEEDKAEAAQQAENTPADPQATFLISESEKNAAQVTKTNAEVEKVAAETDKVQAQTAEIIAGVDREDRQQILDAVNGAVDTQIRQTSQPQ